MKCSFLILFLLPLFTYSQIDLELLKIDTSRHIPNGSNTILVQNSDFLKACNALIDAGFTIDKKDNELKIVQTKEPDRDVWYPFLTVRVKNGITIIKAKTYYKPWDMWTDCKYFQNKKGKPSQNANVHAFLQGYKVATLIGGEIECKVE